MDFKIIKEESLAHYDRMISCADNQPKRERISLTIMNEEIDENWWNCAYCVYCNKNKLECKDCKLWKRSCCNGLWDKMNESKTWGTWVKRARKVREYIEING